MNGQGKLLTHYLKNADKLIIPVYQRNYDWREEHCRKLYQDLVRTIQNKKRWHFFGGIVSVSDPMGSSSDYLVIDGQQRITTVSLLLLAMANLIKDGKVVPEDDTLYAQITKKYLVDEINPKNRKVKLKPIKGDQDAYDRLWGDPENFARSSNITQNYLFFYNEIQKQAITIDQLFKAIEKLQIIDITLTPPDDDPQLVFESLNSTGLELNEGDKIRNFVLMGLDIEEQERYYDSYWNPIEKNAGYDKQNNSYDVSPFIRDYLSIKNKKISSMKDIYTDFKAFADKRTGEMEEIMKDLLAYAKRYNKLLVGHQSFPTKLKASIFRLNRFESSVTRPFLMEVLRLQEEGILTEDEVTETCRIVESYLLRRIICDLPSNTLAKVFLTLSSDIRRFDGTYNMFIEKLKYVLTSKKEKAAFPDDEAFAEGLKNKNIYAMPPRYKAYLFERLENGDSSEYKEIYGRLDSGEYTIEHIMPQKLTPVWISELKDDAETIHSDWLHRLANLTLTAYNSKYSNSPFSEKKTMQDGYLQSGIKMNQRVAQKEHWGLAELEERCGYLTQQAIQLWPYAASSYTPPQKQYDEVALDDEINLTGRTLVKYRFRGMEHDTTSWAEMYAAVLKELHNADKSYLNYLADADDSVDLSIHVSRTSDNYTSCVKVDEDIYVWTGTTTQYKINLLRKFLEQYKQDPSDLVFFLDDAKDTGSEDEAERHKIRRKYWEKALPLIQKTTGSFQNANPQKNNAVYGGTNKPGVLITVADLVKTELVCNGDFRSRECIELLDEADIVVTNPPFSLFREYMAQLIEHDKKFLIIGNKTACKAKEIFPYIKDEKVWLGRSIHSGGMWMRLPKGTIAESKNAREEDGFTIVNVAGVRWFTNLKSVQHQGGVSLEGNYYSPDQNPKYLNYDAIDVESVNKIPCDYEGEMGVPISIFDKLDTDQFELVGIMSNPETLPGIRVIGPEWVDLYRSQGGTGHITANMKSLVGIDANGNAVSYYERVIIRNKNPKPRRNI